MEKRVRTEGGVDVMHDPALERIESDSGSRLGDHSFNPEIADITEQFAQRIDRLENSVEVATNATGLLASGEDPEPDSRRALLQLALQSQIEEIMSITDIPRAQSKTTVADGMSFFARAECIILSGYLRADGRPVPDRMWTRPAFMEAVLSAENLDVTLSSISHLVKAASQVDNRDTIGAALIAMAKSSDEQVAVLSDGIITGVLTRRDIDAALLHKSQPLKSGVGSSMGNLRSLGTMGDVLDETPGGALKDKVRTSALGQVQKRAQDWVETAWTELLIIILLVLDISISAWEGATVTEGQAEAQITDPGMVVTGVVLIVYVYEAMIRIIGYRMSLINGSRIIEGLDVLVVAVSVVVFILTTTINSPAILSSLVIVGRVMRLTRGVKILIRMRKVILLSRNRYTKDGFNLDLTYVTPSCIAMQRPEVGANALWGNPVDDVARFFLSKHREATILFDLGEQKGTYDPNVFGAVEHIPVREGDPLKLEQLAMLLSRAAAFSDADSNNIIVVHCRTGLHESALVVCALLMHLQFCESAADALHYFYSRRLGEDVKIDPDQYIGPSQRRYLQYTQAAITNRGFRPGTAMVIKSIRITTCPGSLTEEGAMPWFSIEEQGSVVYESCSESPVRKMPHSQEVLSFEDLDILVSGDLRLNLFNRLPSAVGRVTSMHSMKAKRGSMSNMKGYFSPKKQSGHADKLLCFMWFHTGFIDQSLMVFTKPHIDMAAADTLCTIFRDNFRIEVEMEPLGVRRPPTSGMTAQRPESPTPSEATGKSTSPYLGAAISKLLERRDSSDMSEGLTQSSVREPLSGASTTWGMTPTPTGASLDLSRRGRMRTSRSLGRTLGPWRKLQVEQRLVDRSRRQRGIDQQVEMTDKKFRCTLPEGIDRTTSSFEQVEDNLCPVLNKQTVEHSQIRLVSLSAVGDPQGHDLTRRLLRHYKQNKGGEVAKGPQGLIAGWLRKLVSGKKKRFKQDGFDLDLTYITGRIIAMGWPSRGFEGNYRNSEDEVYRFFMERHAGHFNIVNLVAERDYNLEMFHGAVARYPFSDHNPPAMEMLLPCCAHIHSFLQAKGENVVAIHCKAGKGRTGLIIVCYLVFAGLCKNALAARTFYDNQRTSDGKGLTIISQIRYAHYFEEQLRRMKEGLQVGVSEQSSPAYELKRVRLHGLKGKQQAETWDAIVKIAVKTDDDEEFELFSSKNSDSASRRTPDANAWELDTTTGAAQVDGQIGRGVRIAGDMRVLIVEAAPSGLFGKRKKVVEFWMHTSFFEHPPPQMGGVSRKLSPAECTEQGVGEGSTSIMYRWDEIDGVARDTKHKVYDQTFMVELLVQPLGRCGIGHQTRMDMRAEQRPKTVPYQEKKDYQRYCEEMSMLGKETMPFDNWIMKHSRSSIYSLLSSQTMPSEGLTSIDMYKMLENGDGGEMERTESVDARLGFREQKDSSQESTGGDISSQERGGNSFSPPPSGGPTWGDPSGLASLATQRPISEGMATIEIPLPAVLEYGAPGPPKSGGVLQMAVSPDLIGRPGEKGRRPITVENLLGPASSGAGGPDMV